MTRWAVAVVVSAIWLGCASLGKTAGPASVKPTASSFYPFELGTRWSYEVNQLGHTSVIEVAMLKRTDEGFIEDSTGAQLSSDAYGVRDQKRYLLRNPVEVGNKWTNVVSVSSIESYEIVSVNQRCDAPAGKWEGCVVVEARNRVQEGTTLVNEMTFAPGVGIVRLATVLESNGRQIPQTGLSLLKFSLPGQ
jgi:hypothetical protein